MFEQGIYRGTLTVDKNWRITHCCESLAGIFKKPAEQLLYADLREILVENGQYQAIGPQIEQMARSTGSHSLHSCILSGNDPSNTSFAVHFITLPDDEGNLLGACIVFYDMSIVEEASRRALDSIADGVFTVDKNWKITSFNHAAETITGWKKEEVLGKTCESVFRTNICSKNCAIAQSFNNSAGFSETVISITTKDGNTMPIAVSASPLFDAEGNIMGGVEIFKDISNKLQYETIINSVADGVLTVNEQGMITFFNTAAEKITGWKSQEVIGEMCSELLMSNPRREECPLTVCMAEKRSILNEDLFMLGRDGFSIPISASSAPFLDHRGKVVGGVETFRDNTSRLQHAVILDSIADGVFTVDRDWHITSFNHAAELITGWTRDKALGKTCSEVFHSSICGRNCAIAESLYTGKPVANRSITIKNLWERHVAISISAAPLVDQDGNVIGGVETFRDLSVEVGLRHRLLKTFSFNQIISKNEVMQRLFQILPDIARSESTVLILGESGTGKELIARAIYSESSRDEFPFVVVNCGAIPETLLESELFGYKAGAFTDAKKDRIGRFAAAEGGTLFLDEIGDIPMSLQVKLLRVLQQKVYEPLGSNTSIKANVRIIAATNRDLKQLVAEGRFREDLYYRLNVVDIHLPPLRERIEDIPLLVDHIIQRLRIEKQKDIVGVDDEVTAVLVKHQFPGNIRELENILEYAFILCPGGYIRVQHLPDVLSRQTSTRSGVSTEKEGMTLETIEKQAIIEALDRHKGKKMKTCRELGISKDTLRRKLTSYGLLDRLED